MCIRDRYTSSETNSVSTITAAKKYCDDNKIAYEESSIANVSELQTAVESLISKGVDALYTGNDNTIASAMATYTAVSYTHLRILRFLVFWCLAFFIMPVFILCIKEHRNEQRFSRFP